MKTTRTGIRVSPPIETPAMRRERDNRMRRYWEIEGQIFFSKIEHAEAFARNYGFDALPVYVEMPS